MPLANDAPIVIANVRMQCLATNLTLEFACFVSTNEVHIPTIKSCVVMIALEAKRNLEQS
jgi:hypothetical protein